MTSKTACARSWTGDLLITNEMRWPLRHTSLSFFKYRKWNTIFNKTQAVIVGRITFHTASKYPVPIDPNAIAYKFCKNAHTHTHSLTPTGKTIIHYSHILVSVVVLDPTTCCALALSWTHDDDTIRIDKSLERERRDIGSNNSRSCFEHRTRDDGTVWIDTSLVRTDHTFKNTMRKKGE